jgi:regulator of RNase E activity RraA
VTTADDIAALAAWDTPALSNALDALRLRSGNAGYTDGSVTRVAGSGIMTGRAVTARMVARDPGDDGIPVARLHRAVSEAGGPVTVGGLPVKPGDILHGDEHGVLSIPAAAVPRITARAELIRQEEQRVVAWSRSAGFSVPGLLALRRVRH